MRLPEGHHLDARRQADRARVAARRGGEARLRRSRKSASRGELTESGAARGGARGRHRRGQVQRSVARSPDAGDLHLGQGAGAAGQHRALSAVRLRAHPLHPPQERQTPAGRRSARSSPSSASWSRRCCGFPTVVERVVQSLRPHQLAEYLFELANSLQHLLRRAARCSRPSPPCAPRASPCATWSARTLQTGLDLLGIDVLERM